MRKLLICFAIALAMGTGAVKAAMPEVRIAVLKFGTVNWVMDTIKRQGYDTAAGYRLVLGAAAPYTPRHGSPCISEVSVLCGAVLGVRPTV